MNTDARAVRSRKSLLDAGRDLLLKNPAATLSQIAVHAGVGRATLYRHFETRDQLVQALAQLSLEETDAVTAPLKQAGLKGRAAIEATIDAVMPLADHYHFLLSLWNFAEVDPEVTKIYDRQVAELVTLVEQAKTAGEINRDLDTNWIVTLIDSMLYSGWWLIANQDATSEDMANHAKLSLFQGIAAYGN